MLVTPSHRTAMLCRTSRHSLGTSLATGLLAIATLTPTAAMAQDTVAEPAPAAGTAPVDTDAGAGEIVVTGSRLNANFSAPTPVTSLDAQLIESRSPTVLVNTIALMPSARGTATPNSGGSTIGGTGGGSFVNLRGLGTNRTLVLFNGQRMVPTTDTGIVDLALLPQALVKQLDIVTGGASAAYGSDAVAGVVNLVLDPRLRGIKLNAEAGISQYGDAGEQKFSIAAGHELGSSLHWVGSLELYRNEGIPAAARQFGNLSITAVTNPNVASGQKALLRTPYIYLNNVTYNGVIVGGPLAGTEFLPGGATRQFVSGCQTTGSFLSCGRERTDLFRADSQGFTDYAAAQRRINAYTRLTLDVSPEIEVYADALYGKSRTVFHTNPPSTSILGTYTIRRDNAFLPASVAARMDMAGVATFQLGRVTREFGPAEITREAENIRGSVGGSFKLGGSWKADAYLAHGESHFDHYYGNVAILARFNEAADAVLQPGTNRPICRSTLTTPTNACVPLNLFGLGSPDSAAQAYVFGTSVSNLRTTQTSGAVNIAGEPFSTWAGPVAVGAGVEYRSEKVRRDVDPISAASGFAYNNPKAMRGNVEVKEAFAEVLVPLATDMAFAKKIEVNAAVRQTDYSTSGAVTSWKVGGNYEPTDWLRFRAVRSRDIRAPNALELNSPVQVQVSATQIIDPVSKQTYNIFLLAGGNPNLKPEIADTLSFGGVLRPLFMPGLSVSLDYYKISLKDAIATPAQQQVVDSCAAGDTQFCPFITRNAAGAITAVTLSYVNFAKIETSGVDLEVAYRRRLGEGEFSLRVLGNYLIDYVTDTTFSKIDTAGQIGTQHWGWDLSASYSQDGMMIGADAQYLGGGLSSVQSAALIENNEVEGVWYFNATLQQTIDVGGGQLTFYLRGENLTDKRPPFGYGIINGNYDRVGRYVKFGVRAKF